MIWLFLDYISHKKKQTHTNYLQKHKTNKAIGQTQNIKFNFLFIEIYLKQNLLIIKIKCNN